MTGGMSASASVAMYEDSCQDALQLTCHVLAARRRMGRPSTSSAAAMHGQHQLFCDGLLSAQVVAKLSDVWKVSTAASAWPECRAAGCGVPCLSQKVVMARCLYTMLACRPLESLWTLPG